MEILRVKDLSFTYPNSDRPVLSELNFTINSGDFVLLMGETGSGKSTLLRLLKKELAPLGKMTGEIAMCNFPRVNDSRAAIDIGFVGQNPSLQVVTDNVYSELSFGLESLGVNNSQIRSRVAEIAICFGLEAKFREHTDSLSGGKLQLLNLASVMVMTPQLLLLDEPTSQLDPVAAAELLSAVKRLNQELGLTVIIAEHRTEEVMPLCNRVIAINQGRLICDESVRKACEFLSRQDIFANELPTAARLYASFNEDCACPISISEGRELLSEYNSVGKIEYISPRFTQKAVEMKNVCFRYKRELPDVLKNLNLTVYQGECLCLFGGNASGKTTVLSCIAACLKPYCGKIKIFGKSIKAYKGDSLYSQCLSYLPQEVSTVFSKNTVGEELAEIEGEKFSLQDLSFLHPYDLSGGEMQLLALAKAMAARPRLLLLDEPAKGLDYYSKKKLVKALKKLKAQGVTIILVTHEAELAAELADRCALFFDGDCVCVEECRDFLLHNSYFTTPMARMTKQLDEPVISVDEALKVYKKGSGKG